MKFTLIFLLISVCVLPRIALASPTSSGEARLRPPVNPAIDVSAEKISVKMDSAPLAKVLGVIAERTGARVVLYGSSDESISAEFHDQPLEEGLRRILRGKNVAFSYKSDLRISTGGATVKLFEMRVFLGVGDGAQATIFSPISSSVARTRPKAKVSADQTQANANLAALTKRLLESKGEQERQEAAAALGKLTDPAVIEPLSQALSVDAESAVRVAAAEALGKTWDESVVAPLSQSIASDGSSAVREAAARALGLTWSEIAVPALTAALLIDRDALVREQAARALGQTAGEEAVAALAHALAHDPRSFVRDAAAEAIGTIGGREALEVLARAATHDPDIWVKQTAAEAALNSPK